MRQRIAIGDSAPVSLRNKMETISKTRFSLPMVDSLMVCSAFSRHFITHRFYINKSPFERYCSVNNLAEDQCRFRSGGDQIASGTTTVKSIPQFQTAALLAAGAALSATGQFILVSPSWAHIGRRKNNST
jgi:hypothetical protein